MTPDQVQAAAARGSLAAPQMRRRPGGTPLSNKELPRRLLAVAPIGSSGGSPDGASEGSCGASAADGPESASPVPAPGGPPGTNGLGSESAAAIELLLRGRLQGQRLTVLRCSEITGS